MSDALNIAIARAIKRLASEHGVPNSFSAGEIALESGMWLLQVGQALATELPSIAFHSGYQLTRVKRVGLTYIDVSAE